MSFCEVCKNGKSGFHKINVAKVTIISTIKYQEKCSCSNIIKVDAQILSCNACSNYYLVDSVDHIQPDKQYNNIYLLTKTYANELNKEWNHYKKEKYPLTKDGFLDLKDSQIPWPKINNKFLEPIYSEVLLKDKKGRVVYDCEECGLNYLDRKTAEECEAFCKKHHQCSLEIGKKAVSDKYLE